jgi:hypothetical protein
MFQKFTSLRYLLAQYVIRVILDLRKMLIVADDVEGIENAKEINNNPR